MKKGTARLTAAVMALMILLSFSACEREDWQAKLAQGEQLLDEARPLAVSHWEPVAGREGYESLNPSQKLCYLEIYRTVEQMEQDEVVAGQGLTKEEAEAAVEAYFADNSEQFWLSEIRSEVLLCTVQKNPLMQAVQDFFSALMGQEPPKEPLYSVQFQARYLFEPDQLEDAKAQMKEQMEQAYAQLSPGMSEFDREAALHDWLMTRCSYSDEAAVQILENGEELDSFLAESTAYGAVVCGEAVCTGYADAMKLLLGGAGVRCAVQQGKAPGPDGDGELAGHVWNIVTIDGEPYHLDPTWDDLGDWTFDGQDSPVLLKEMQG
ncbi:MAG: hypothetical protein HFE85_04610, partial [Clostridiales bacterium]|nr:hypothetical protein [Clostridiales bacterium]